MTVPSLYRVRLAIVNMLHSITAVQTFTVADVTKVYFKTGDESGDNLPIVLCSLTRIDPFSIPTASVYNSILQVDCVGDNALDTIAAAQGIFEWFADNGDSVVLSQDIRFTGRYPQTFARLGVSAEPDLRGAYLSTVTVEVIWQDTL